MSGNNFLKNKSGTAADIVPWLIFSVVLWAIINTTFKKDYQTGIIEADAKGYYAYLPATIIYHDLNFGFYNQIENKTYYNPNLTYEYLRQHNGKTINKYYAGTALFLLPFFLMGHTITLLTDLPSDGYSFYYTMMVHLGALFYFMLAVIGIRKLLKSYQINKNEIAIVLIAIVFGTNLFYYVVTEFAMSHLYSLTAITWFCITIRKYLQAHENKHLMFSALLLGLIALIRPVNMLIVLAIPFLSGDYRQFVSGLKSLFTKKRMLFISTILFVLLISIQLIIYKISTGSFIVYSYKEEGFNFSNPQIVNFLFSYRKGMFVYTPLLLLSLSGFYFLFRSNRFQSYTLLGFLFILIYIFSSWHMWFYGGSFSQRVMVEFYAFFAILLAIVLQKIRSSKLKFILKGIIVLLIIVCQIQTYQYRRMQIHWSDMNKQRYWEVFMRIDKL